MLRSIVSSIEFEKFRRNWSEKELSKTLFTKAFETQQRFPMGRRSGSVALSLLFAPIFLRRTHVILSFETSAA
ncbi:hypothetical protein LEP1GSC170_4928 [Leptospira interrogans serovar Bataviae str. HAI135]|nr:hypothetical protein LEP1GSC170_4928 [Leptospira interrogans serovar Bataviae str. HAI135]